MSIGIFGGSFNPIHCGHIALAQEILRHSSLQEVWLMVSPQNPLKQQSGLLPDEQRLLLASKALEGVKGVKACDFECRLPRPSYTWTTLQALSETFPQHRFTLIIGQDNWQLFDRWYRATDIRRHYPIIVYPRPDAVATPIAPTVGDDTLPQPTILTDMPLFPVSSTLIRQRVSHGEDLEGLVPAAIMADVEQLYRQP